MLTDVYTLKEALTRITQGVAQEQGYTQTINGVKYAGGEETLIALWLMFGVGLEEDGAYDLLQVASALHTYEHVGGYDPEEYGGAPIFFDPENLDYHLLEHIEFYWKKAQA